MFLTLVNLMFKDDENEKNDAMQERSCYNIMKICIVG